MIFSKQQYKRAIAYVDELFSQDKEAVINEYLPPRTLSQNRLMWLWFECIMRETGNDKNYIHKFYVQQFLPKVEFYVNVLLKIKCETQQGTSDLNRKQFKEFLDKVKLHAEETFSNEGKAFYLPRPEDNHFKEFQEFYGKYIN